MDAIVKSNVFNIYNYNSLVAQQSILKAQQKNNRERLAVGTRNVQYKYDS
jgi:hypothetical protein